MSDETDIYQIPYLTDEDLVEDTPKVDKAQAERIDYLFSVNTVDPLDIARAANPVGTIIAYGADWGWNYAGLADPDTGAPFHLPCTGGAYHTDDFPTLAALLGHTYLDSGADLPDNFGSFDDKELVSGKAINESGKTWGEPFMDENVKFLDHGSAVGEQDWRPDTSLWMARHPSWSGHLEPDGFYRITMDGFAVPDFRGRSPIGTGGEGVAKRWTLGERYGDKKLPDHQHQNMVGWNGGSDSYPLWDGSSDKAPHGMGTSTGSVSPEGWKLGYGFGENYHPSTGVNFLIFTGQVVQDHSPIRMLWRGAEAVYRLHAVTTARMIHNRLADPDISDEERAVLEAQLEVEMEMRQQAGE